MHGYRVSALWLPMWCSAAFRRLSPSPTSPSARDGRPTVAATGCEQTQMIPRMWRHLPAPSWPCMCTVLFFAPFARAERILAETRASQAVSQWLSRRCSLCRALWQVLLLVPRSWLDQHERLFMYNKLYATDRECVHSKAFHEHACWTRKSDVGPFHVTASPPRCQAC